MLSHIVPTPKNALTLKQALDLCNLYLENAYEAPDNDIALVLCRDAEVALSQVKSANKRDPIRPGHAEYQVLRDGIAAAYIDLGKLLERKGYPKESLAFCKKTEKWGYVGALSLLLLLLLSIELDRRLVSNMPR
jgi:hypothetical protein